MPFPKTKQGDDKTKSKHSPVNVKWRISRPMIGLGWQNRCVCVSVILTRIFTWPSCRSR